MKTADDYFAGTAKKKWVEGEVERQVERRAWQKQNEDEKQERIKKEKEVAESLRKKMDAKGGSGLMMATAEEAVLLRGR